MSSFFVIFFLVLFSFFLSLQKKQKIRQRDTKAHPPWKTLAGPRRDAICTEGCEVEVEAPEANELTAGEVEVGVVDVGRGVTPLLLPPLPPLPLPLEGRSASPIGTIGVPESVFLSRPVAGSTSSSGLDSLKNAGFPQPVTTTSKRSSQRGAPVVWLTPPPSKCRMTTSV